MENGQSAAGWKRKRISRDHMALSINMLDGNGYDGWMYAIKCSDQKEILECCFGYLSRRQLGGMNHITWIRMRMMNGLSGIDKSSFLFDEGCSTAMDDMHAAASSNPG